MSTLYTFPVIDSNDVVYSTAHELVYVLADGETFWDYEPEEAGTVNAYSVHVRKQSTRHLLGNGRTEEEAYANAANLLICTAEDRTFDDFETLEQAIEENADDSWLVAILRGKMDKLIMAGGE